MIEKKTYYWLFALVALAYIAGLFLPLMENDSAQFGGMALRMYQHDDYLNIYKQNFDYLDKPHLHFWLAAFSFKIFGVHEWSYRLPAILFSILGAWSTFKLGKLLYNEQVGRLAALVLVTAQAFILANHDVRTDAVLLGATIFGLWGLIAFIKGEQLKHMILGATGVALAFSTKGQIAVFIVGISVFCFLLYERKWQIFWNWKVLVGLGVFLLVSSPMVYAYYQQFDLHPEKVINGQTGISGVRFIFWDQSFARLTGQGGMVDNPDYFFFYHTFLWAFLPWCFIAIAAIGRGIKDFYKIKFIKKPGYEFLTLGGILVIFHIINFSQFKLPHYINILFPLFAIITAGYLYKLYDTKDKKALRVIRIMQMVVIVLLMILLSILSFWVFPIDNIWLGIIDAALLGVLLFQVFKKQSNIHKIIIGSALAAALLNFVLNTNFYPKLFQYQSGGQLVQLAKEQGIGFEHTYILNDGYSRSLDFYSQRITPSLTLGELKEKIANDEKIWLFVYEDNKKILEENGIHWKKSISRPHFHVSMVTGQFLNPSTRNEALANAYLLELN